MFLQLLTAEQQLAFARAASYLVHVDDDVDEREVVLLDELMREMGLKDVPPVPDVELVEKDLALFGTREEQRILVLELASIVTADGERHEDELSTVRRWMGLMGDPGITLDEALEITDRAHAAYRDARDFILRR